MNLYQYGDNEVVSVIDRCYVEIAQGRSRLAVDRLMDLDGKFPNHPNVLYALGQIHRDHLGSGKAAYRYLNLAYDSAIKQKSKSDTAWFCVCNLVYLSPSEIDFRKWTNIAIQMKGSNQNECKSYARDITELDKGVLYINVLIGRYMADTLRGDYGDTAALAEIILQAASSELAPEIRIEIVKTRMICLRRLDENAWNQRKCMAEDFPPDERVTLAEAIRECQRIIELDPYEATYWNYKSAWHLLLRQYDECIRSADQAITLRPHHYPRPHVNKSAALREMGDMAAALVSAKEALAQASDSELGPGVAEEAKYAVFLSSQPQSIPSLAELTPQMEKILSSAMETSQKDIERFRGVLNLDDVAGTLMSHIQAVGDRPFYGYVPKAAELLMMFTPETAFVASLRISKLNPKKPIVDYCTAAAWYVACVADGVLRRDAARYLALMTLYLGHPDAIRLYYRQAFLAPSAAARGELAKADSIMREELFRIHSGFPSLIADQSPVTTDECDIAIRDILRHFDQQISQEVVLGTGSVVAAGVAPIGGKPPIQKCETCSNRMQVLDFSGKGSVLLSQEDLASGVGHAEQCWECGRLYCADCYPKRPPNTCVCGCGRDAVHHVGDSVYKGSLRLVKVRNANAGNHDLGNNMTAGLTRQPSHKKEMLLRVWEFGKTIQWSRNGTSYEIDAPITIHNVIKTIVVDIIIVAIIILLFPYWKSANGLAWGSISIAFAVLITTGLTLPSKIIVPTACGGCSKTWSDIVRVDITPQTVEFAGLLARTTHHKGYVCRKCGLLLCEHCRLMQGSSHCPQCQSIAFSQAWLCEQGRIDADSLLQELVD